MVPCFGLSLMLTHACNMRCSYCYVGGKSHRTMDAEVGRKAIDRAVQSIAPEGTLELGFFGGEPLLEASLIEALVDHASAICRRRDLRLDAQLTTNGTVASGTAWDILARTDIRVHLSHDGLPEVHDRHRRTTAGAGTSDIVLDTLARLNAVRDDVGAVMVVRSDGVDALAEGVRFLRSRGVRHLTPSLDLWDTWTRDDAARLERAVSQCADVWREGLPQCSISWFDEKAARLAGVPIGQTARCGFGNGELAVAPSGNLYPCERLIGEDAADNPMRLPGHATNDGPFAAFPAPERSGDACAACSIQSQCGTTCRCANYVRTGDVRRPDGLLCLLDKVCLRETARVLGALPVAEPCPGEACKNWN